MPDSDRIATICDQLEAASSELQRLSACPGLCHVDTHAQVIFMIARGLRMMLIPGSRAGKEAGIEGVADSEEQ